jgi:hypothetical protein
MTLEELQATLRGYTSLFGKTFTLPNPAPQSSQANNSSEARPQPPNADEAHQEEAIGTNEHSSSLQIASSNGGSVSQDVQANQPPGEGAGNQSDPVGQEQHEQQEQVDGQPGSALTGLLLGNRAGMD